MTIYSLLRAAGIPTDNHASDLYFPVTEASTAIVAAFRDARNGRGVPVNVFTSNIDGKPWYDIPFAFDPWWEARRAGA